MLLIWGAGGFSSAPSAMVGGKREAVIGGCLLLGHREKVEGNKYQIETTTRAAMKHLQGRWKPCQCGAGRNPKHCITAHMVASARRSRDIWK